MSLLALPPDYEKQTIAHARKVLDDIPECASADYEVRFLAGVPHLILIFELEMLGGRPACAVRLVSVPREVGKEGTLLEGDRLSRRVRESVEHYLHRHGVRFYPDPN